MPASLRPASGRLDRRVVIERQTVTGQDELGQDIVAWQPWKTVRMGKHDITASERFRAQQELAAETVVWTSHWIEGLLATDRLVHDGKVYDIEPPVELGRKAGLEITATAVRVP